jgi:hypothetical protein
MWHEPFMGAPMHFKRWTKRAVVFLFYAVLTVNGVQAGPAVDYEAFLGNHDMVWDRIPNRWEVAPYTGNGNVGFTFYQAKGDAKNVISIFPGRHDYYDHRLPDGRSQHLWIFRCRLPLGRFNVESKGDITGIDLRLDLWNAELRGTVKTSSGSYEVRALTHSTSDVIYFETDASDGESIKVTWHPEQPYSSVRKTLEKGGGPKGGGWEDMRTISYPLPPEPVLSEADGLQFCLQPLYQHRGETTTGWTTQGAPEGKQVLLASVHHSFPEKNSLATVRENLLRARALLAPVSTSNIEHPTTNTQEKKRNLEVGSRELNVGRSDVSNKEAFFSTHRAWWHDYYPQSFLTLNDPEKEAFYWVQMYKLASATRENGPIIDCMGPWYHYTFWPMIWGDLNVQLIYWTHLAANRMSIGESLPNSLDKHAGNLEKNVPERWKDSMALGPLFPQDCLSFDNGKTPDMLAWVLHNYWLHCEYAGDRERMRDGLFPKLRKNVNGYLNYLRENPVPSEDGTIHIKQSWSPEYPAGHGQDINFTIGLLRWACQTLLNINEEHGLNDPLVSEWQRVLDKLVDFQIDENGLRIGKDIAFEKPHRHYSHLLAFFPLAVITPENPEDAKMLRATIDHWLDVSINRDIPVGAMPVTGYTATGAASMYAWLGDGEKAYHYLNYLIKHKNISSTTMYAEGNPVIESPLSFATSLHDMLLQSWGGTLRVFRGTPAKWQDVAFHQLRGQGAFLVSAKKKGGVTQFVTVVSLAGSPCRVQTDIENPEITINGEKAVAGEVRDPSSLRSAVTRAGNGIYEVELKKGDTITFATAELKEADMSIAPIPVAEADRNLFGLSEKTTRLPGHGFYYKD